MLYDAVLPSLPVKMYYYTIAYFNIIAKFHNISIRNFFDNKDLNDDIINDFKL